VKKGAFGGKSTQEMWAGGKRAKGRATCGLEGNDKLRGPARYRKTGGGPQVMGAETMRERFYWFGRGQRGETDRDKRSAGCYINRLKRGRGCEAKRAPWARGRGGSAGGCLGEGTRGASEGGGGSVVTSAGGGSTTSEKRTR